MTFFLSAKDQEISELRDAVEYWKDKSEVLANVMYRFVKFCEKEGCVVPSASRKFQLVKSVLEKELGQMVKEAPKEEAPEEVKKTSGEVQCERCKKFGDPKIIKFGADEFATCPKCGHTWKLSSSIMIYRKF